MLAVLVIEVLNVFIAGEHWIAVDLCRDMRFIVQALCLLWSMVWKRRCGILWIVRLTLLVLVRDYVYPCAVVLGGLLVLVGALLWLPICFLSTLVVGCMWSADALWQYRLRRNADARNVAAKKRKTEAPASTETRRLREKEKRKACKKTMRDVGRIRRTWREMNENIDAKHGKMVGMVCRPTTHDFMCSAIGVGWYAVVLLVSMLVADLVVLDIDTMVAG